MATTRCINLDANGVEDDTIYNLQSAFGLEKTMSILTPEFVINKSPVMRVKSLARDWMGGWSYGEKAIKGSYLEQTKIWENNGAVVGDFSKNQYKLYKKAAKDSPETPLTEIEFNDEVKRHMNNGTESVYDEVNEVMAHFDAKLLSPAHDHYVKRNAAIQEQRAKELQEKSPEWDADLQELKNQMDSITLQANMLKKQIREVPVTDQEGIKFLRGELRRMTAEKSRLKTKAKKIQNQKATLTRQASGQSLRENYAPVLYDKNIIMANQGAWLVKLQRHFVENLDHSAEDAKEIAREITKSIILEKTGDVNKLMTLATPANLKERALNVDFEDFKEFMVADVGMLARQYARGVGKEISWTDLMEKKGYTDFNEFKSATHDDFQVMINKANAEGDTKEARRLLAKEQMTIKYMDAMYINEFGLDEVNKTSIQRKVDKTLQNLRKGNVVTLLYNILASSLVDPGRIVANAGVGAFASTAARYLNPKAIHADYKLFKDQGIVVELINKRRLMEMAGVEVADEVSSITKGMDWLVDKFGTITGISAWNQFAKQWAVTAIQHRLIKSMRRISEGRARSGFMIKDDIAEMRRMGWEEDEVARLVELFDLHGSLDGGVEMSGFEKWLDTDEEMFLQSKWKQTLVRIADNTINTPDASNLPMLMTSEVGKTIGQFNSFMFASHKQHFIPMMQAPDVDRLMGIALSVGLASLTYQAKEVFAGRDPSEDEWGEILTHAIDQSGDFAFLFNVNNRIEQLTGNAYGLRPALGQASKKQGINQYNRLSYQVATVGQLDTLGGVIRDAATGDFSEAIKDSEKLTPYVKMWYWRWLTSQGYDKAEEMVEPYNLSGGTTGKAPTSSPITSYKSGI